MWFSTFGTANEIGNEGVQLAVWVHKMRSFLQLLYSLFFNLCDLQDDERARVGLIFMDLS